MSISFASTSLRLRPCVLVPCPHHRVPSLFKSNPSPESLRIASPRVFERPSYFFKKFDASRDMPSSTKKRTTAKKQQQQQQPPPTASSSNSPGPVPPATTPASAPALLSTPPSASPPTSASSSSMYKPITDYVSIERLVGLAKDSPHDSALGIVWQRAFEEGKKIGYSEGAKLFEGVDISEGMRTAAERGYERGVEAGRAWEKRAWGAAGHSSTCITVARPPRGVAVQTDDLPPRLTSTVATQADTPTPLVTTAAVQVDTPPLLHVTVQNDILRTTPFGIQDASSQTSRHPSPIPNPIHIIPPQPSTSLNWADDTASLPILSTRPPPRDLSALRSTKRNPFGSLQRRSKQSRAQVASRLHQKFPFSQPLHSRYRLPPLHPSPLSPKPRILPKASKNEPLVHSPSVLDWDQDPRLSDLSRALKALGWIRPYPRQGRRF